MHASARIGTDKIESDSEKLGSTTLLRSTNQDLGNTSNTIHIIKSLGKSENEGTSR